MALHADASRAGEPPSEEPAFANVRIAEPPTTVRALPGPARSAQCKLSTGAIEIVLANGRLVRVGDGVDPNALRLVIAAAWRRPACSRTCWSAPTATTSRSTGRA